MTDCSPISSEMHASLACATESANQWRGRCVNLFARAEFIISRALASKEPDKRLPMLVSQKAKRLASHAVSDEVHASLDEFVALLADRTALAHGSGKLWVNETDQWLLSLDWIGTTGVESRSFTTAEAKSFHESLRTIVQRLERRLRPT